MTKFNQFLCSCTLAKVFLVCKAIVYSCYTFVRFHGKGQQTSEIEKSIQYSSLLLQKPISIVEKHTEKISSGIYWTVAHDVYNSSKGKKMAIVHGTFDFMMCLQSTFHLLFIDILLFYLYFIFFHILNFLYTFFFNPTLFMLSEIKKNRMNYWQNLFYIILYFFVFVNHFT